MSERKTQDSPALREAAERKAHLFDENRERRWRDLPDVRIKITDDVGVIPKRRPPAGSEWDAKELRKIHNYGQTGFWIRDERFGRRGVIVYEEECEVLE